MILSFVLLAVGGCDIGLMVKIRRQLSDPQQFFTNDRNGNVFAVEFIKPVIGKESLPELLGLPDRHFSEPEEKISYLLQVQGAPPRWVEVGFSFKEGLLQRIQLPPIIYELLGSKNIFAIMRVCGGATGHELGIELIPVEKVRKALADCGAPYDPSANSINIRLSPSQTSGKNLLLTIRRQHPGESYGIIEVVFKVQEPLAAR